MPIYGTFNLGGNGSGHCSRGGNIQDFQIVAKWWAICGFRIPSG